MLLCKLNVLSNVSLCSLAAIFWAAIVVPYIYPFVQSSKIIFMSAMDLCKKCWNTSWVMLGAWTSPNPLYSMPLFLRLAFLRRAFLCCWPAGGVPSYIYLASFPVYQKLVSADTPHRSLRLCPSKVDCNWTILLVTSEDKKKYMS